jgi:hypothetical protein
MRSSVALAIMAFIPGLAHSRGLPKRQNFPNEFNPSPSSGFDDPTSQVADPAFGTFIQAGYQGPMDSQIDPELTGPVDLVRSGTLNDVVNATYTFPLYSGQSTKNKTYWFIVTDTSDEGNSRQLGINFSSKLKFCNQGMVEGGQTSAESVTLVNNTIAGRSGMVDFTPVRNIVPGSPQAFPPKSFQPGSVGDANYSPLIEIKNAGKEIWNAPIIAFDVDDAYLNQFCNGVPDDMSADFYSKVHDQVVAICPANETVTYKTIHGFSFGKAVLYIIGDSSDPLPATIDGGTYAPRMKQIEFGGDDSFGSCVERIFVNTNGHTNADLPPGAPNNETHHPFRQGLNSAILGEGKDSRPFFPLLSFHVQPS